MGILTLTFGLISLLANIEIWCEIDLRQFGLTAFESEEDLGIILDVAVQSLDAIRPNNILLTHATCVAHLAALNLRGLQNIDKILEEPIESKFHAILVIARTHLPREGALVLWETLIPLYALKISQLILVRRLAWPECVDQFDELQKLRHLFIN